MFYESLTKKQCMPLFRFGRKLKVYGGSYYHANTDDHFCVKMAKEIELGSHVSIPTEDFRTPSHAAMAEGIHDVLEYLANGGTRDLYVGCMGGKGRTGLFMACLAKAWGKHDPVRYVRKHYLPTAVETEGQKNFVKDFKVPWALRKLAWKAKLAGLVL